MSVAAELHLSLIPDLLLLSSFVALGWIGGTHRTFLTSFGPAWQASFQDAMATCLMERRWTSLPRLFPVLGAAPWPCRALLRHLLHLRGHRFWTGAWPVARTWKWVPSDICGTASLSPSPLDRWGILFFRWLSRARVSASLSPSPLDRWGILFFRWLSRARVSDPQCVQVNVAVFVVSCWVLGRN